jgi:NADH-quinone oxidoreductase subunit L
MTTTITMGIGALGLAGMIPLAGFFSKDEILAAAFFGHHRMIWICLLAGTFLTAFYTFRMFFLAFYGRPRMSREVAHHVHESPTVMTMPLLILAGLTTIAGVILGFPGERGTPFARFLEPVFGAHEGAHSTLAALMLVVLSVITVVAGIMLAGMIYTRDARAEDIERSRTPVHALLLNAYYVDWIYDRLLVQPLYALSVFLARAFDLGVIDGIVDGLGRVVAGWAAGFRRVQTGFVVNYALTMLVGAVALVGYLLMR